MFQFQTGSIKSELGEVSEFNVASFNSKLVRLKVSNFAGVWVTGFKFQFQTGSIKSSSRGTYLTITSSMFQFQTGSIKSELGEVSEFNVASFNSKLVRLKVEGGDIYVPDQDSSFNSKLVRLKGPCPC